MECISRQAQRLWKHIDPPVSAVLSPQQRNSLWPPLRYLLLLLFCKPPLSVPVGRWYVFVLRVMISESSWDPDSQSSVFFGLLGFTFQPGAISLVPAWRAVSYLEWTAVFPLFSHTDSASDRFAPCLLSVYAGDLFSLVYACCSFQNSLTSCKISWDELQRKHFVFSLPLVLHSPRLKGKLLKMFPDRTQLMWRKSMWGVNVILAEQIRNVFHGHIPILVQA